MAEDDDRASTAGQSVDGTAPAQVMEQLVDLVAERDRAEARRRELTEQIRATMRRAHDLGVPWSRLAEAAGYSNAETARVQALRRDPRDHPEGSYSIREAADTLGVSPQTIYAWIKSGRVKVAVDRPRGRRVYLSLGQGPAPVP